MASVKEKKPAVRKRNPGPKKKKGAGPKTISYLRVSTADQDLEKFRSQVLEFANAKRFGHVDFIEERVSGRTSWRDRKIAKIIDGLKKDDRLIVPEMSRLGRSTLEVLTIIKEAKERGAAVYSIKEGLNLNGNDMQSKIMATMLALFSELERDFISQRTKEGLAAARAKGRQLGRPKGPGKSKLDKHREEIIALLKTGSTKTYISKKFKTTIPNLTNWLKKNKIDTKWEL